MCLSFSYVSRYSMEKEAENDKNLRKELYPFAVQIDALIPSQWNPKDKHMFMKLSHGNCRVQYKGDAFFWSSIFVVILISTFSFHSFSVLRIFLGPGKSHKDAAAVRADFSVPVACGLFYFEVTIISKGRDGYIGIGLSEEGSCLNRLPGWDKRSYGYHGDDGNSFASSGTGFPYGPTFTTGDVIGCGVNMENRTCFYTKNGINLGVTFTELPLNLFPIVGLQTPGEVVEANFGQSPFVYNIMDDILDLRSRALVKLRSIQLPLSKIEWTRSVVASYLVHQGYAKCAEEFNRLNGFTTDEPLESIRLRQSIRNCIMDGQISQAISLLEKHFPMVINNDMQMKHLLMCWQFIEIFSENSYERARLMGSMETAQSDASSVSPSDVSLWEASPVAVKHRRPSNHSSRDGSPRSCSSRIKSPRSAAPVSPASIGEMRSLSPTDDASPRNGCELETYGNGLYQNTGMPADLSTNDEEAFWDSPSPGQPMDVEDGVSEPSGGCMSTLELEKVIAFGRDVCKLSKELEAMNLLTDELKTLMRDAFSLIAYDRPMESPFSYLFEEKRRVALCVIVNSAILKRLKYPSVSKLEVIYKYATYLRSGDVFAGYGLKILAPMVRVTTLPFRLLALNYGADLVYTEEMVDHKVIRCQRIVNDAQGTIDFVCSDEDDPVFRISQQESSKLVFQIVFIHGTSDPGRALAAAQLVEEDVAAIDVNMGCPKSFSLAGGMGAALLNKPYLVEEILTTLVKSVRKPVTCKIRLLPKLDDTLELCKLIERCGVSAVAIHGRTTAERSTCKNHNASIAAIARSLRLPVIANGGSNEIFSHADLEKFREATDCRHVMIGRAAIKNPSIFCPEGLLDFDSVVATYLEYATRAEECVKTAKYVLQRMYKERNSTPDGQLIVQVSTLRELWSLFGMEKRFEEIRSSIVKPPVADRHRSTDKVHILEVPFIRKHFDFLTPKVLLTEWSKQHFRRLPIFSTESRVDDSKFISTVDVGGFKFKSGCWASNRRYAEQAAALVAIFYFRLHKMLPQTCLTVIPWEDFESAVVSLRPDCSCSGCLEYG
ncbi:hypothetical protein D918_00906 [Trichuris suis]|nr:hypothetical protein D918_00906 [Trichuris suis]